MASERSTIRIRPETAADAAAIARVHDLAFGGPDEAGIVARLRASDAWLADLSLVAESRGVVVGHVVGSRATIVPSDERAGPRIAILAIGPVGVLPEFQRRGIGASLMRAAIVAARARTEPVIVLLGHPGFYRRFGFVPARSLGIEPESEAWPDEAWLALDLRPAASAPAAAASRFGGRVRYASAFGLR